MSNHTPGPWRVTRDHTPGQLGVNERIRDKHNWVICNLHVNADANGRLIAAAPDMLAALQGIEHTIHKLDGKTGHHATNAFYDILQEARAAIAKAQGEG